MVTVAMQCSLQHIVAIIYLNAVLKKSTCSERRCCNINFTSFPQNFYILSIKDSHVIEVDSFTVHEFILVATTCQECQLYVATACQTL